MYIFTILPLVVILIVMIAQWKGANITGLLGAATIGFATVALFQSLAMQGVVPGAMALRHSLRDVASGPLGGGSMGPAILFGLIWALHMVEARFAEPVAAKTRVLMFWAMLVALLLPGIMLGLFSTNNPNALNDIVSLARVMGMIVLTGLLILVGLPLVSLARAVSKS